MTAEVLTSTRFGLDASALDRLRGAGVKVAVVDAFPSDDEIGLLDPQAGEVVLGTLDDDDFAAFVELWRVSNELGDMVKAMTARQLKAAADDVEHSASPSEWVDNVNKRVQTTLMDDEEAKRFFELSARSNMIKAVLYYDLSTRFDCHEYEIGVRSRRRFVRKDRRY